MDKAELKFRVKLLIVQISGAGVLFWWVYRVISDAYGTAMAGIVLTACLSVLVAGIIWGRKKK